MKSNRNNKSNNHKESLESHPANVAEQRAADELIRVLETGVDHDANSGIMNREVIDPTVLELSDSIRESVAYGVPEADSRLKGQVMAKLNGLSQDEADVPVVELVDKRAVSNSNAWTRRRVVGVLSVLVPVIICGCFLVIAIMIGASHENYKAISQRNKRKANQAQLVLEAARTNSHDMEKRLNAERVARSMQLAQLESQLAIARQHRDSKEAQLSAEFIVSQERLSRMRLAELRLAEQNLEVTELQGVNKRLVDDIAAQRKHVVNLTNQLYQSRGAEGNIGTEEYEPILENHFVDVVGMNACSTFSVDVDTASYSNVRRFLNEGRLPPSNAVRVEELVNYFDYDYPEPTSGSQPFSVQMEAASCPWNQQNRLVRIGLKGKSLDPAERPDSNLVFLIDVSGSMNSHDKLPLLQKSFAMMVKELTESDRVSIVTYAGNAATVLKSARGDEQKRITSSIDSLSSGGSTNGSGGIEMAYRLAQANFIEGGTNRVIWATDGDLNVGVTNDAQLVGLIKDRASEGVCLTVLGFGTGNLKDAKLEKLADNGNGFFAYIDSLTEAHKVLVRQLSESLVMIAKDVKLQVEFNPELVKSYRLVGYENRVLSAHDFANDRVDAGDIGAGHTVTAFYEIVPQNNTREFVATTQELKYQSVSVSAQQTATPESILDFGNEVLTLSLRYKSPDSNHSTLSEFVLVDEGGAFEQASQDFRFAASVASYGMLLRGSSFVSLGELPEVLEDATNSIGSDSGGFRAGFVQMVNQTIEMQDDLAARTVNASPVQGTITSVKDEFVAINLGTNAGIRSGIEVLIFRESLAVGKATVINVKADLAVAEIRLALVNGPVRVGDRVQFDVLVVKTRPQKSRGGSPNASKGAQGIVARTIDNFLAISMGTDDGVRVGAEVSIYRASRFIGKATITKVESNISAARIQLGTMQEPVKEGDNVWLGGDVPRSKPSQKLTVPPASFVTGLITKIRGDALAINLGTDDGVRVGCDLTIFRNGRFIGKATITKSNMNMSAATVDTDLLQSPVNEGDNVSVSLAR